MSLLSLSLFTASFAGAQNADAGFDDEDGGVVDEGDAGALDCTPRCDGEVLVFCDEGARDPVVAVDCSAQGATCGLLSESWGFDCLLPLGAVCEPGYAEGLSRCEGSAAAALCCVEGVCAAPGEETDCRAFVPGAPTRPAGTSAAIEEEGSSSCLGCTGFPGLGLLPLGVGLGLRRRRSARR
ncbi:MAG: hypothetical protein ACO3JL_00405 [Myxococcota bacterium]